jgi:uncharacterized membrane protein YhaH (DUF805 family)
MDEHGTPASGAFDSNSWQFLYRSDKGVIDAPRWRRGALFLFGLLALLTLGFVYVRPYTEHDLAKTPLLSASVIAANLYDVLYAFALIFIGISYYNLSAKRWRDIGRPPALAGLLPFLALVSGALHWIEARDGTALPPTVLIVTDAVLVLTLFWNLIDLGGLLPKRPQRD